MDDDGNLDYVSEDDYTEELWNELSRKREGHLARVGHHYSVINGYMSLKNVHSLSFVYRLRLRHEFTSSLSVS